MNILHFEITLTMRKIATLIFILCATLAHTFTLPAQNPALVVKGENFLIQPLTTGTALFLNRDFILGEIPAEFNGWEFTKINANSSYWPGPAAIIEIEPEEDGLVYVMVEDKAAPEAALKWATENGWEAVPGPSVSYGTAPYQELYFYKKYFEKGIRTEIVQPVDLFSGAILTAPKLVQETNEELNPVAVSITSDGKMETAVFESGVLAFSNRTYVFENVSLDLAGLMFTRYDGGAAPGLQVTALETGELYIGISELETDFDTEGWEEIKHLSFNYNDHTKTSYTTYKKGVTEGEVISIKTSSWTGIPVFSRDISYTTHIRITPPPGIVVHNSKAETHRYVGSPTIAILPDGSYVAAHDHFGNFISDTYIYRSADRGLTWEPIAEIRKLTWSTLFIRGEELYLFGVRPDHTGYGDCVILKSLDGGETWTDPADNKSGLLISGYYHCAPVPVVFHKGKIWRAMELNTSSGSGWGPFAAFMMSIDENADLLDASNWTFSNKLLLGSSALPGATTWLEGNAVVAKDGSIKNILRLAYNEDDTVAILDISDDGKTCSFKPATGFGNFPGSGKKFTIRFDPETNKYWSLTNYVLEKDRNSDNGGTRNTVTLAWSDDLVHWNIKDTLLHHPDRHLRGFQYLDWLFDGEDIIAVSRTAWEDETGFPPRQHDANYMTFHRFEKFRYEKTYTQPGISVKTWKEDAASAFALTFDDGFKAHYDYAYPMLKQYGIPATFFVNSSHLVNYGENTIERYGIWEEFREMAEEGYEIASHSFSHANLTALNYTELAAELEKDKVKIEQEIPSQRCLTHAYPFCLRNEYTDGIMEDYFIAGRACGEVENAYSLEDAGWFRVSSELLTWASDRTLNTETAYANMLKNKINTRIIPNRSFGVVCIHEVLPFDLLATSDTYEIATTEWMENICRYLQEQRNENKVWPATFTDIVKYAKQRDNLRVKTEELEDGTIIYSFTDWLDDEIFNIPLTIDLTLPVNIQKAEYYIMEGDKMITSHLYEAAEKTIRVNIVPDKQTLLVKTVEKTGIQTPLAAHIHVFPNPVKDRLTIEFGENFNGICKITDIQGKLVYQTPVDRAAHEIFAINMQEKPGGVYILNLMDTEGNSYSKKIVK